MNKFILAFATLIFISFSISSCSKCYTCDFGDNDIRDFCPKDFPDKADGLKMTIDAYEKQGYKCSAK
jgi:hypothetical protein